MQEALEIAYSEDIDAIYIEPPEPNVLTDEDSGDEDCGGNIDNLSGRQLRALAEVKFVNKNNVEEDIIQVEKCTKPKPSEPKTKSNWVHGDLISQTRDFPVPDFGKYKDLSPRQLLELFLDNEILRFLIEESSRYALFKNIPDPKISIGEMKCFLSILLISGYSVLPGKRFYWESQADVNNSMVSGAMRRDRFVQIMRCIHCADNSKADPDDKVWKLRPFINKLKSNFIQHYQPEKNMSYDESMIRYYGRHPCKQFIRGKPIRFGYKMWALNTTSGYLVNFELYQGKSERRSENYEKEFGKAAAPFVSMLDNLGNEKEGPYHLYFDNLFTGMNLLQHLKDRGYQGTGTFRENRIPKDCPITDKKTFSKKVRGSYEGAIEKNSGIMVVRWADNNVVTVASTCHGILPVSQVKRYSQAEKKIIQVSRPNLIGEYNSHMGGTDLMDENLSRYRIGIRSKKWWWSIFTWLIDVAVTNAWQIHKKSGGKLTQLEFRREIATGYLQSFGSAPKPGGRPKTSKLSLSLNRISDDVRYDGINHLVIEIPAKKRRRCAGEGCISSIRTMCSKCNMGLCIPCFYIFHTK